MVKSLHTYPSILASCGAFHSQVVAALDETVLGHRAAPVYRLERPRDLRNGRAGEAGG